MWKLIWNQLKIYQQKHNMCHIHQHNFQLQFHHDIDIHLMVNNFQFLLMESFKRYLFFCEIFIYFIYTWQPPGPHLTTVTRGKTETIENSRHQDVLKFLSDNMEIFLISYVIREA